MLLQETLTFFFPNAGKTENVPESEFKRFYKTISGRLYTCDNYTVTTRVFEFTQPYICYKFSPIKKLSELLEFHIWRRDLTIQIKHSYITKCLCVLFH